MNTVKEASIVFIQLSAICKFLNMNSLFKIIILLIPTVMERMLKKLLRHIIPEILQFSALIIYIWMNFVRRILMIIMKYANVCIIGTIIQHSCILTI
jgi:hypothetical protein